MHIRDASLAARVDPATFEWWRVTKPVTAGYGDEIAAHDFSGRRVACFQHVLMDTAGILLPLVNAGADVRLAACNPDSTDDVAAAYLQSQGVEVFAWSGMSEQEFREGLAWAGSDPVDAISDMGGELISATAAVGSRVDGALEATTSGLHRLEGVDVRFPVLNWNDALLKDRIHNRHHVGMDVWPMFSALTGLGIHGRSVLVLGFGPVGRGVALRALALGAIVSVVEPDPVRAFEAQQHGCRVVEAADGVTTAAIVVTATGHDGVLGPDLLHGLSEGAFLCNVGHTNREIDIEWLARQPHQRVRRHIDRYDLAGTGVFLLNRGSILNLSPGVMPEVEELFDPFSAMMLRGLAWVLDGGAADLSPGIQPYPEHLEREIAERALASRR